VRITRAALDEEILSEARSLRDKLDELLPSSPNLDPSSAVLDPVTVVRPAQRMARDYRMRARLQRQFDLILVIATLLAFLSPIFLLASLAGTAAYFLFFDMVELWVTFIWIAAVDVIVILGVVAWYGILNARVQAAVEAGKVEP
jgi:hypothetical protein